MQKLYLFLSLLIMTTGCATQRMPFPAAEYAALHLTGDKTVKGTVFLIDQFEEKQVGAGSEVTLEPVTSYSEQWHEVCYLHNKSIKNPDPRYEKYVMHAKADEEGRFLFTGVAPGEYMLTGPLFWEGVTCSATVAKTKVMICKKITIKDGDSVLDIPLTKKYGSPLVVCDLYNQAAWEKEGDIY
jgi:hypothetical protein